MAEGPLLVILEMIKVLIESVMDTLAAILELFGKLMGSSALMAGVGGPLGLVLAMAVIAGAAFFVGKFVLGSAKSLAVLFAAGLLILLFIIAGLAYMQA